MKKKVIISLIALMVISVGLLSGCTQTNNTNNQNTKPEIETVTISGMNSVQTVNNRDNPIRLIVSAMGCDITVTKETNLTEVILSGMNSIVRVSHNHSFISTINGMNSKIIYYD